MNIESHMALLNKILPFVLVELEGEVQTRSGYSLFEICQLFVRLNTRNFLQKKDYKIMFAVLNEICNGIRLSNYIPDKELKELDDLMDRIDEGLI